jgi:outer membrane protein assembly factor BamE
MRLIFISAILLAASGCSLLEPWVYRLPIVQGNLIDQEQVDKLQPGMTPKQVLYVLGTPQTLDPFKQAIWRYDYHFISAKREESHKTLVVYFENGHLARLEGDFDFSHFVREEPRG